LSVLLNVDTYDAIHRNITIDYDYA